MPGKDLPLDPGSFVQGMGYMSTPTPTDGCSLKGTDQDEVMGAPYSKPAPLQAVSAGSETVDAPALGARQKSSLHQDGYLDYLEPHMGNTNS